MADCIYLLDSNILSSLIRDPAGSVARRIAEKGEETVCTSSIVVASSFVKLTAARESPSCRAGITWLTHNSLNIHKQNKLLAATICLFLPALALLHVLAKLAQKLILL